MKRKHKHEFVRKIWPIFFWQQCCICKDEFRREYGWVTYYHPVSSSIYNNYRYIYMCQSCASTKDNAELKFLEYADKRRIK